MNLDLARTTIIGADGEKVDVLVIHLRKDTTLRFHAAASCFTPVARIP